MEKRAASRRRLEMPGEAVEWGLELWVQGDRGEERGERAGAKMVSLPSGARYASQPDGPALLRWGKGKRRCSCLIRRSGCAGRVQRSRTYSSNSRIPERGGFW